MGVTSSVADSTTRAVGVSKAMLLQKAADLVGSTKPERALVLRAKPEWTGGDLTVRDRVVRVVPGVSQLGILDFLTNMAPDDYAIILTDRARNDLGNAVLSRAYKNDIQMPDEWQAIPRLFEAREVSRELRRLDWAATALLDHQPVGGWPKTAEVAVSDTFAVSSLLNSILGLDLSTEFDSTVLMSTLGRGDVRSRWASIDPGLRRHLIDWVEAGVGSGALSMSLLRAVGDQGSLHSFERRDDFATIAKANVREFFGGDHPAWTVTVGDLVEQLPQHVEPGTVDRVVLDMLAPWECLDVVADALAPGGVLIAYVATATQLSRVAEAARDHGGYTEPSAWESMVRGWHLEGLAVRPQHRMHGHTGFLISTRRLAPGVTPPLRKRRPAKGSYGEGEAESAGGATPEDFGERPVSDKKVRKLARSLAPAEESPAQERPAQTSPTRPGVAPFEEEADG